MARRFMLAPIQFGPTGAIYRDGMVSGPGSPAEYVTETFRDPPRGGNRVDRPVVALPAEMEKDRCAQWRLREPADGSAI